MHLRTRSLGMRAEATALATWRIVYNGRACSLAVPRGSSPEEIEFSIKHTVSYQGNGLQYELANGSLVVLSSALPDGTEVHCKPKQDWAAISSGQPGSLFGQQRHSTSGAQHGVEKITVRIRSLLGKITELEARTHDTVRVLKERYMNKAGASMH